MHGGESYLPSSSWVCPDYQLHIQMWYSHNFWLVVWNMNFIFPYIGIFIIPIDELIFFRGVDLTTNHIHRLSIDYSYTNHILTNQICSRLALSTTINPQSAKSPPCRGVWTWTAACQAGTALQVGVGGLEAWPRLGQAKLITVAKPISIVWYSLSQLFFQCGKLVNPVVIPRMNWLVYRGLDCQVGVRLGQLGIVNGQKLQSATRC